MADPLQRALLRVAAGLDPNHWSRLVNGEPLVFSSEREPSFLALPHPLALALRSARPGVGPPGIELHSETPEDNSKAQLVRQTKERDWTEAKAIRVVVWLELAAVTLGPLWLESPPGQSPALQATLSIVPMEVHPPDDERHSHPSGGHGLSVASQEVPFADEVPVGADPLTPPSAAQDRTLARRRRFQFALPRDSEDLLKFQLLNRVLPRIAEVYEVNLVADAYRQRLPLPVAPSSTHDRTLTETLDQFVRPGASWSKVSAQLRV